MEVISSDDEHSLAGIYLLFADLVKLRKNGVTSFSGPGALLRPSRLSFFSSFQHWAIQVRGTVYEVTANSYGISLDKQQFDVKISSILKWEKRRDRHELRYEKIKLGLTEYSDVVIKTLALFIWDTRFKVHPKSYDLHKQNCQNFAFLLYETIKIDIVKKPKGQTRRSRGGGGRGSKTSEWQEVDMGAGGHFITISKYEQDSWKTFPIRYTEYVQVGKLISNTPKFIGVGGSVLSIASSLAGSRVTGAVKDVVKGAVVGMETDMIMFIGLAGLFATVKIAERRSRDEVWLRKMKDEAIEIVEEAESSHVFSQYLAAR